MLLTRLLPATDVNWATSSIDSIRRHSAAKQTAFNRILLARIDLVRLTAFSAIELCVHLMAAVAKFTIAVIELPACLVVKGLSPRAAFNEAHAHTVRSVKLAVGMLCAPLAGLANPLWSISLYQRLALVNEPQGRFGHVIEGICSVARNPLLLGTLLVGGALIGRKYFFTAAPIDPDYSRPVQYIGKWLAFFGVCGLGCWANQGRMNRADEATEITEVPILTSSSKSSRASTTTTRPRGTKRPMSVKWFQNVLVSGYKLSVTTEEETIVGQTNGRSYNREPRFISIEGKSIYIESILNFDILEAPEGMTPAQWQAVNVEDIINFRESSEIRFGKVIAKDVFDKELETMTLTIQLTGHLEPDEDPVLTKSIRYIHHFNKHLSRNW